MFILSLICALFQPEVPVQPTDEVPTKPIEEAPPTKPTEEGPPSTPKGDTIIKYRIEKERTTPDVDINGNLQDIIDQIGDHLQKQNLEKSNEVDEEIQEEEIQVPLTPEMEHANTLYHQGMKLINGTTNKQYET